MTDRQYAMLTVIVWVAFFLAQVLILHELPLTILAIAVSALLLSRRVPGEIHLFAFGILMSLIIELGLGLIARSQNWSHASLFGIPFWLPLMWGYGFVVMRRIGNVVVETFGRGA